MLLPTSKGNIDVGDHVTIIHKLLRERIFMLMTQIWSIIFVTNIEVTRRVHHSTNMYSDVDESSMVTNCYWWSCVDGLMMATFLNVFCRIFQPKESVTNVNRLQHQSLTSVTKIDVAKNIFQLSKINSITIFFYNFLCSCL